MSRPASRGGGLRTGRWFWLAALLLTLMLYGACSLPRAIEAFLVIEDVAAGSGPSRLKDRTAAPVRKTIRYEIARGSRSADVYRAGDGADAKAVAIVVPGVVRLGKDDPRIIAFAETLARVRFLVFVPDLQSLRDLTIRSDDIEELSGLVSHLAATETPGAGRCIGIVAFSYAAGPAILAAMNAQTQNLVRFVHAVGPYYDIEAVGAYLTTGYFRTAPEQQWQRQTPSPYATWVFVHSSAAWLETPQDRQNLRTMAETKLADPQADVSDLASRLGAEGQAVYRLLLNTDPAKTSRLISQLPPPLLAELRRLDLRSRNMADLKAELILVHGRDDTLIPHSESVALAAAAERARTHLFVIRNLAHVELGPGGFLDLWKLWRAAHLLLRERDAMPAPAGVHLPPRPL